MAIYYVDPTYGLDTNDGLTPQAPLRRAPTSIQNYDEFRYLKLGEAQIVGQATWRNLMNRNVGYPTSAVNGTNPFQLYKSNHALTTGDWVVITRPHANQKPIMGLHQVTVIDSNNFTIPVDGTGISFSNYSGCYMVQRNAAVVSFPLDFRNYTKPIAICGTGTHPTHGLSQPHLSDTVAPWTNGASTTTFRYSTSYYDMQLCAPNYLEVTVSSSHSGKLCYKSFDAPLDLSSFKGITFWSRLRSGSTSQDGMYIALCSDTNGDVPVHTTPIIKDTATDIWSPQFHDFGTFLDSNINSIAIYKDSTTSSTNYWNFQGFLACKGLDTPEQCINYTTIISPKRAADDTYHRIHTIIGETVLIDDNSYVDTHIHTTSANQWQGYNYLANSSTNGTNTIEESLDTWLIHAHNYRERHNSTTYNITTGSYGALWSNRYDTVFSGGWEIDGNGDAIQPEGSLTWMHGNGTGSFYYKQSQNNQILENFGAVHWYRSIYDYYGGNLVVRNCRFAHNYQGGYTYRPSGSQIYNTNFNNCYSFYNFYYYADTPHLRECTFTNMQDGIKFDQSSSALVDKCTFKNIYRAFFEFKSGGVHIENCVGKNVDTWYYIDHDNWGGNPTMRKLNLDDCGYLVHSDNTSRIANVYVEDFTLTNPKYTSYIPVDNSSYNRSKFPGTSLGYGGVLSVNSNFQNDYQVVTPNYMMKSDYNTYNTAAPSLAINCLLDGKPSSWSSFPQDIVDQYTARNNIVIASIALDASAQTTISCFLRRNSTNLNARIGIMGYHVGAGEVFSDDITSNNAWEEVSITFTPTKKGVVELLASIDSGWYQSSSYFVWADDISVTLN
jgi:hypothetical protein